MVGFSSWTLHIKLVCPVSIPLSTLHFEEGFFSPLKLKSENSPDCQCSPSAMSFQLTSWPTWVFSPCTSFHATPELCHHHSSPLFSSAIEFGGGKERGGREGKRAPGPCQSMDSNQCPLQQTLSWETLSSLASRTAVCGVRLSAMVHTTEWALHCMHLTPKDVAIPIHLVWKAKLVVQMSPHTLFYFQYRK